MSAVAYLAPAKSRKNLTVKTGCRVLRILMQGNKAVGIEYLEKGVRQVMHADKEIILSCGAINSPRLLMLSGIGPAEQLEKHGIKVVQDLPGVGQNLQDHIEISLVYELTGPHSYDKYKKPWWKLMAGFRGGLLREGSDRTA